VAIKFLAEDLEADPRWLARFIYEARTVAALDHPNIVTIHASEETEGRRFLVMELVRGTTLDHVIPPGGLPLDRFYDLALPIVDAVGAAHDRGVTHRDLKPGNIVVDEEGRPKVLDFGLARSSLPASAAPVDTDAPTQPALYFGSAEGTLRYMARSNSAASWRTAAPTFSPWASSCTRWQPASFHFEAAPDRN